jgi:hypothetical protein
VKESGGRPRTVRLSTRNTWVASSYSRSVRHW